VFKMTKEEFKAGDWVLLTYRYDNCTKTTIEKYMWENLNRYGFDSSSSEIGRNSAGKDRATLELWQPKTGEWVWAQVLNSKVPTIIKVTQQHIDEDWLNSSNCEPFIGKLPSFVKDTK
jgi:hypothetical protein